MKLSHESKIRLGVGIGAFVLIIGLVFGTSRTLIHFDGPWDLDDVVSGLSGMDDAVDEDDLLDGGNYSARPQQLSSTTFDEDAFQSLDLDVTSGTVEVKRVSGGPVRVIESGRVAKGASASDAATQNLVKIEGSTLKISQFDCDDERAHDRKVTIELPRELADNMMGITANVGLGDLTVADIACHDFDLTLDSGDVAFAGTVTDTLNAEVGLGDATFELYQAPAKSMDVSVDSGDVEMTVPNSTGFKASLTVGSGDFESDFLPLGYDGETILNLEFDNGDKSATYRFKVGLGDMSFDSE
ncbi:DUF4097 family beta strand repeat-containing protein [Collinsella aerofaciens]|uniref:DUF4097 family beta strand repeat-containing protein n=2 Tax=Collinsella aerofaciens TaxID=74426 RepID=A0AAW6AK94_9ACTN|nr:DUF4097 family beta strand repeat-containing protein [Collinsella aerofaciens]MDB1834605.1 DUF4097 family beta strand repeat-containing protein [Collinsella aerofaciens]MDB1838903.1 DUF4097 family beta strand repeat-containing protein [Collinsella aerofaciens]MDB1840374.1 DUF4097 family beta strand repeat-containing protein [Collinsella aerofaciens]MDB1842278.1 DUF4097 family beta strand repeat-containing protein [Collinsella aerofaciens]MDB1844600.1 DUF4097 family beta strand repeat-contai